MFRVDANGPKWSEVVVLQQSAGHPHSDEMKLEERFQRVEHDTIQASPAP
jgi:hypothetical protein